MLKTRSYQIPSVEGEVEKEGGMKEMGDGRRMGDDDDGGGKEGERRSRKKRGEQFQTGRGFSCGWRQASAHLVFACSNDMSLSTRSIYGALLTG
jgi:hypothetical protein